MADIIEDLFFTGGLLWLFSLLIKGLVFFISGIYIILFSAYTVCKEIHRIKKAVRENRPMAGKR